MSTQQLLDILSHMRPHNDAHEKQFVETYIVQPLEAKGLTIARIGPMENLVVGVGPRDKNAGVLFSCHTDTVHANGGKQEVIFDANMGVAYKVDKDPLGADDGTGVWLLLQMIERGVPGTYVFHRGEERGCVGSHWMEDNSAKWLKEFSCAIAFDRKDLGDVITHQRSRRTCSDEFATALAEALNTAGGFKYKPSSHGIYTDTANYDGLIPECTNVSIGYDGAHSAGETQDVNHAVALLDAICKIDWEALPIKRTAKREVYQPNNYWGATGWKGSHYSPSKQTARPSTVWEMASKLDTEMRSYSFMSDMLRVMPKISGLTCLEHLLEGSISDLTPKIAALVRLDPARAVIALRHALVYYQYYTRHAALVEKFRDSGALLELPMPTVDLLTEYAVDGATGILVERPKSAASEVQQRRAERKAQRKAKKHAKRKGGGVSNTNNFLTSAEIKEATHGYQNATRPSDNPLNLPLPRASESTVLPVITPLIPNAPEATPTPAHEQGAFVPSDPWEQHTYPFS
jgi:hypothetical protein